jgi:FtsP/CotA-like multicopper oxidase with cupredoxin domain
MGIDRRGFISGVGAGAALLGLAACSSGRATSGRAPAGTDVAETPFVGPSELRSEHGSLAVTLVAKATTVAWAGGVRYALAYNDSVPGPTLRVRAGDTLTITLRNELDDPTNLHTHGLHVSPDGASDNIFVMVDPGASHTYTYVIPADHPSGTYWYHPHHHGFVAAQLAGGLAGVIVVEDELDDLPAVAATTERILVVSDPTIGTSKAVLSVSGMAQMLGREGDEVLVNGQLRPVVSATAGTTERWRLVNASASRYYRLVLDGGSMSLMASDHGRLESPVAIESLLLTPGQRAEVLVPLHEAGTLTLRTEAVVRSGMGGGMGGGMMGGGGNLSGAADLLSVQIAAGGAAPALPAALRPVADPSSLAVSNTRELSLGAMGMGMSGRMFVIDGRTFDANRIDQQVAFGAVEDWTIRNVSMMDHPFHLHVWPMWVMSRSDGSAADPGWRDTVNVPAGQSVTVRIRFVDFDGTAVYHCHILDHEDLGMMGMIDVA